MVTAFVMYEDHVMKQGIKLYHQAYTVVYCYSKEMQIHVRAYITARAHRVQDRYEHHPNSFFRLIDSINSPVGNDSSHSQ